VKFIFRTATSFVQNNFIYNFPLAGHVFSSIMPVIWLFVVHLALLGLIDPVMMIGV
jgi:hypothetical protein